MGDFWRPDRRSPSQHDSYRSGGYIDSDQPYDSNKARHRSRSQDDEGYRDGNRRDRYRDDYSRRRLKYDDDDEHGNESNDPYGREVNYSGNHSMNRSDDMRFNEQMQKSYDQYHDDQVPNGEKDIDLKQEPFRFVLVRGLKKNLTEDLFAKGMEKFYNGSEDVKGGARQGSLHRVFIVRGRRTDASLGYGYAEYFTTLDAQAAVDKTPCLKKAGKDTIGSAPVELHFPHWGVFPTKSAAKKPVDKKFTFAIDGSRERHIYCNELYYLKELVVNDKRPQSEVAATPTGNRPPKQTSKAGMKRSLETLESSPKKVKTSGSTAAIFQHWQKKKTELHEEDEKAKHDNNTTKPASGANAIDSVTFTQELSDEQTFAVMIKEDIACLLCGTRLKADIGVEKHVRQSEGHASCLKDESKVATAYDRLKQKGIDPENTIKIPKPASAGRAEGEHTTYHDRAAERRQGEKFSMSLKGLSQSKMKRPGNMSSSSSDNEPAKPKYGKGLGMLQKAGWQTGEGLGAGGGITAPIDQNLYASGVGLGHESSKKGDAVEEASRMTRNDGQGFLEKTKELARKRYEQMRDE